MTIYKKNNKYYSHFKIHGEQRHFLCQGARTISEAQAIEDAEKFKLRQQQAGLISKTIDSKFDTIIRLYEKHSEINKTRSNGEAKIISTLKSYFNQKKIVDIKPSDIEKFKQYLLKDGYSPASVNKYKAVLSKTFSIGVKENICLVNPVSQVKNLRVDNKRIRILGSDEEMVLFRVMNWKKYKRIKRLIIFALNTGMRRSEIINVQWNDIDKDFAIINVLNSKSGKSREIPINKKLKRMLKAMYKLRNRDSEYIFTNPETNTKFVDFKKIITSLFKDAKLHNFTLHCCRHTFATRLLERGADIRTVQELLGHSSVKVTEIYTHTNKDKKYEAVCLL